MAGLEDALARLSIIDSSGGEAKGSDQLSARRVYARKSRKGRKPSSPPARQSSIDDRSSEELYQFSADDERKLADAFACKGPAANDQVLTTNFNIQIHRKDIRLLQPDEWLNDEVINFYTNLLQEHCDRRYSEWHQSRAATATSASSPSPSPPPKAAAQTSRRPARRAKEQARQRIRSQQQQQQRKTRREREGEDDDKDQEVGEDREDDDEVNGAEVVEEAGERPLRCHFFNTFFYPLLAKGGHARVARWTRRVDLMAMDLVVVPVHVHRTHWTLATVEPAADTIAYYDSIHQPNAACVELLRAYLRDEEKAKAKTAKGGDGEGDEEEGDDGDQRGGGGLERKWRLGNRADECPRQMNGSDCGVFACMIARACALGQPVSSIHQRDMPHYRRLMALEILSGAIIPSP